MIASGCLRSFETLSQSGQARPANEVSIGPLSAELHQRGLEHEIPEQWQLGVEALSVDGIN